jgi:predicted nucleic acid-binding protein
MDNISMGLAFGAAYYQLFLEDSSQPFDFPAFRKIMEGALAIAREGTRSSIIDAKVAAHAALGKILHKTKEFKEN